MAHLGFAIDVDISSQLHVECLTYLPVPVDMSIHPPAHLEVAVRNGGAHANGAHVGLGIIEAFRIGDHIDVDIWLALGESSVQNAIAECDWPRIIHPMPTIILDELGQFNDVLGLRIVKLVKRCCDRFDF